MATGLGTYTLNVIKHLQPAGDFSLRAVTRQEYQPMLSSYCHSFRFVNAGMYTATEQVAVARAAAGCDLFHATHYNIPVVHRGKLIVTIHDLTHLLDANLRRALKSIFYAHPMLRLAASQSVHIITVSHYSKANLVNLLGADEAKITVIPNGVDPGFAPMSPREARSLTMPFLRFEEPYVLYLGNLKSHKNVDGLLRAYALLVRSWKLDHRLLIVGEDSVGGPALMRLAGDLRLERVTFVPRLPQEFVRALYCGASATVLPSLEEGFGLPVVESMACGIPVACSNCASIPEVGGDAVEYFDPRSPESIAEAIRIIVESPTRTRELVSRGLARAKQYSWRSSAQEHRELYMRFVN